MQDESQQSAHRQAKRPIAQQVHDHRRSGVSESSQDPTAYRLQPVENLKDTCDWNECRRHRENVEVAGIDPGERRR